MKSGAEETLLARLQRLNFNASAANEETIRLSISGGDVPTYIMAKAQRDVSGNVYYTSFKLYGTWYFPKSKKALELLHTEATHESGWQLLPTGDGKCIVSYFCKIRNDVSDRSLVDTLLSVQRIKFEQFPVEIDAEYQKRWDTWILGIQITLQEEEDEKAMEYGGDLASYCSHSQYNQANHDKTITFIKGLSMCPEDCKQAAIDYIDARARTVRWMQNLSNTEPDTTIDDAASVGALFGSLNENNPRGGALLGALIGGLAGAAHQEEQRREKLDQYDRLRADEGAKRKKFGAYVKQVHEKIKADQESGRAPICDVNDK